MLKDLINYYAACWTRITPHTEQASLIGKFSALLEKPTEYYERNHYNDGHITGSALVVDPELQRVLLTLHAKLGRWLQLGGHADGERNIHSVAMREAEEESGLTDLKFFAYEHILHLPRPTELLDVPIPFDIDIHLIPGNSREPEHFHYDVRFIIIADPQELLKITAESKDLRWFTLDQARQLTSEESMHRQFDKIARLKEILQQHID